jgi:hypothetical protein
MSAQVEIVADNGSEEEAYAWIGRVLTNFAEGEQAVGELCVALGLSIANGSLESLKHLQEILNASGERKCSALGKRIERWTGNRPLRHLLAHSKIFSLRDSGGSKVIVTRHLPRDKDDVTPDRLWTNEERQELLRQATNDGRSIRDLVRNILADSKLLTTLRRP